MDDKTVELLAAHNVLAEFYAERLADSMAQMPVDRSVLELFSTLVRESGRGTEVGDVGCGTGRLEPLLAELGLSPSGIDLSPEMIRVAQRDNPGYDYRTADLRELPYDNASLAGVVCWYSMMYLAPADRPGAFAELARVVKPGGHLVTAFKSGDSQLVRGGRTVNLGIEFDVYWLSPAEVTAHLKQAGFEVLFWGGRPAQDYEETPQAYLIARKVS